MSAFFFSPPHCVHTHLASHVHRHVWKIEIRTCKNTHGNKKVQVQRFAYSKKRTELVEASGEEQFVGALRMLSKLEV